MVYSGVWEPFGGRDVVLEYTMADPYIRLFLSRQPGSPTFSTEFKVFHRGDYGRQQKSNGTERLQRHSTKGNVIISSLSFGINDGLYALFRPQIAMAFSNLSSGTLVLDYRPFSSVGIHINTDVLLNDAMSKEVEVSSEVQAALECLCRYACSARFVWSWVGVM